MIGIGCDVTHLYKFKNKEKNFLMKVLTKKEIKFYNHRTGRKKIEFLAGHFSCKESIIKAMGNKIKLNMLDIEILYNNNIPYCYIPGYKVFISISHDEEIVFTNAIILKADNL